MKSNVSSSSSERPFDLFVVESPLQLINAQEAHFHFESGASGLLILTTEAFSRRQFDNVAAALPGFPWTNIWYADIKTHFVDTAKWKSPHGTLASLVDKYNDIFRLANRRRLDRRLSSVPRGSRVFLGNYLNEHKPYFRHIANAIDPREVILLDDGTDAILVNRQRVAWADAGGALKRESDGSLPGWSGRIKRSIRRRYVDWDDRQYPTVTFFSAFKFETSSRDTHVSNDFQVLRSVQKLRTVSDEVYVLGQCLAEDGYLGREEYVESVAALCRCFAGRRLVYVPHPRESGDTIRGVVTCTGARVFNPGIPIEIALLSSSVLPEAIASFFCTALANCSVVFGDSLRAYAYELDSKGLRKNRSHVAAIYDSMRSLGLRNLITIRRPPDAGHDNSARTPKWLAAT